jgi:hypothetical protein
MPNRTPKTGLLSMLPAIIVPVKKIVAPHEVLGGSRRKKKRPMPPSGRRVRWREEESWGWTAQKKAGGREFLA